jgi:hypothetical protein
MNPKTLTLNFELLLSICPIAHEIVIIQNLGHDSPDSNDDLLFKLSTKIFVLQK